VPLKEPPIRGRFHEGAATDRITILQDCRSGSQAQRVPNDWKLLSTPEKDGKPRVWR